MKRIISIFLLICAVCLGSVAADLTPAQKKEVIEKINTAASQLRTMSCTFVQTKHLSLLSDKMVSEGVMHYSQPNKLRWEYTRPYKYLFIFNGNKVYVGNDSRKDVIDTNTNKVFKEVARIMMSTVTGSALSNPTDFDTDVTDSGDVWTVTLIPKKKDMRRMFAKIVMTFSKTATTIKAIEIYEKNGDRTDIKFKDTTGTAKINESLFSIPK